MSLTVADGRLAPRKVSQARPKNSVVNQFEFVVTTGHRRPNQEERRLIKRRAATAKKKAPLHFPSWVHNDNCSAGHVPDTFNSVPARVGSDLSFLHFCKDVEPYLPQIYDTIKVITSHEVGPYPSELVKLDTDRTAWVEYLSSDRVYLHSMLFWMGVFTSTHRGEETSVLSHYHFMTAIRQLQERVKIPNNPLAISDPTIMVIVGLAMTSEIAGDRAAAENHIKGLQQIVALRGGLGSLKADNHRLPAKVCRLDIAFALRFGSEPVFFREAIDWKPYIAVQGLIGNAKHRDEDSVSNYIASRDERLGNVWKDLREFCRASNLAYQTGYKMTSVIFNEIMVSIFYRLLRFYPGDCPINNVLCHGMMAFASCIYFQWQGMKERQTYLKDAMQQSLLKLEQSKSQPPAAVAMWLAIISSIYLTTEEGQPWNASFVEKASQLANLHKWTEARALLKSVMWIDCIFDKSAQLAFDHLKAGDG